MRRPPSPVRTIPLLTSTCGSELLDVSFPQIIEIDSGSEDEDESNGPQTCNKKMTCELSTEPVSDFLRSLPQDLAFLLPVFVSYGVKDGPSLHALLRMKDWQGWLYTWVRQGKLTEFQFTLISRGLEKAA